MRDGTGKVLRLCETWWDTVTDSARGEQCRFAEELLRLLGWDQPIPFTPREASGALPALPYVLRAGGQTAVAAYFVMPGTLDPPSAMRDHGLDFCPTTRALVDEARGLNVAYAFVTDLYRSFLYDVRTDELILWSDDPRAFDRDFTEVMHRANVERGALEEVRREPRSSAARRLREWCEHWITAVSKHGGIPGDTASVLIDRLLVMRYLFAHDILRRTKWRLQQRFGKLAALAGQAQPRGLARGLINLFHDMWFDWRIDLFEPKPELDRAIEDDEMIAALLSEFVLLSNGKFTIATILEKFNHGDPQEKMRVRMVPDGNEERDGALARQTVATVDQARIDIDVSEEGYRAIFYWFDKMVALYERLALDFDQRATEYLPETEEVDLFAWSEIDAERPGACGDKLAHACEKGIRVYWKGERQFRISRLMLTLHLISRYDQTRIPVNVFPSVKAAMEERPAILPADRVLYKSWGPRPLRDAEEEWEA